MKTLSCTLLGFLLSLQIETAHADVLADWTFNSGGTSELRRTASGGVATGVKVSTLNFNDSFVFAGTNNSPAAPNDGYGFGNNSGDTVVFLRRANYFDNSVVPDPRPTEESYTSWGGGATAGTGSDLSSNGNAPIAFTVTADAITTITLDSLTVDWTGGANIIFEFQEAGASPGAGVTASGVQDGQFNIPLTDPVVILPGQTKTFTINLNSGALNTVTFIDGIALNGAVVRQASPPIADWNFNSGATSEARRTASNVAAGASVSTLNFNASFDDVGVGAVPGAPNDGIGFGGNSGDEVIFLRRADYFDNSAVPDPRPTEESYTSWGVGATAGTGANLSANGNAPIAFTVTADASTTITLDSLTVDWTSGGIIAFEFQEAGASPGAFVNVFGIQDGRFNIPLAAPVVILPGQTKTFTINLNSGSLGSGHNIDGITLNGTTAGSNGSPYQDWALANGLTAGVNDGFGENPDFDAFPNGLEWILGGTTPLGFDATGDLLDTAVDGSNNLVFTFKRIDESEGQATLKVQFSNDLFVSDNHEVTIGAAGPEGSPPAGVTVLITENGAAADDVTVTIPASYAAPNGRLFGRLAATQP